MNTPMKRLLAALAFIAFSSLAQAQINNPTGGGSTTSIVINATCSGSSDDDANINAQLTAAAQSTAYQNNTGLFIQMPSTAGNQGCGIHSLNLTQFNKASSGNSRPFVRISGGTYLCSATVAQPHPACIDRSGATLVELDHMEIRGDPTNPPEICIQDGILAASTNSAWMTQDHVFCNFHFTFTPEFNSGSENNLSVGGWWTNVHTGTGPIQRLGAITAGTGGTPGTYTNVALSGGTCAIDTPTPPLLSVIKSCAIATIVVNGDGTVHAGGVTITYEGRDYTTNDVLTASPGAITGFSVPVAYAGPFSRVMDGQNHWRFASAFQTVTTPVDTVNSLTLVTNLDQRMSNSADNAASWESWTNNENDINSYIFAGGTSNSSCEALYDNGSVAGGIPGPFNGDVDGWNCEGAAHTIELSGALASRTLSDFTYKGYTLATVDFFHEDAGITGIAASNDKINISYLSSVVPIWATANLWTVTGGDYTVPGQSYWSNPLSFDGILHMGASLSAGYLGASNIAPVTSRLVIGGVASAVPNMTGQPQGMFYLSGADGFVLQGDGPTADGAIRNNQGSNIMLFPHGLQVPQFGKIYSAATTAIPSCVAGLAGAWAYVSDATTPTYGGTYTSGGAVSAPLYCNGTAWSTH